VARIGVCEDDPTIRRVLSQLLQRDDHDVVLAHNGGEAMRLFVGQPLDAVVLDIGLPDADGRDVCQALRAAGQQAPVLFLTAFAGQHDKIAGFTAGGDDYVTKPFDVTEVQLRVRALIRRAPAAVADDHGLVLDPLRHAVRFDGREVSLTPTEFRMLAALAGRSGEVVRRSAVVAAAWPDGAVVSDNTVDSYVRRLRVKLDEVDAGVAIHTHRGVGLSLR
jgi:two-component system OmpR family response regulator